MINSFKLKTKGINHHVKWSTEKTDLNKPPVMQHRDKMMEI